MKRLFFALLFMIVLLLTGLALGQTTTMGFEEVARIGQARARGLQYDHNFDRIVWVDALGRLQLVDAKNFEVQQTLYNTGFYNAYAFSHNGRYLALAIDLRVEIWDSNTGELLLSFAPDGALRVEAPLYWSRDDSLISVNTQVRAPQELRRSENDTTNLPWVWDIASELGERRTILPNARAIPFFDYRNGFVYGSNNLAVAGLAERLNVLDITPQGTNLVGEIAASRFEPDPMFAWFSLREDYVYLRPDEFSSQLVQIDTATNQLIYLDLSREYNISNLRELDGLQLSRLSRIIGNPLDTEDNSLMRLFFGNDYRRQFGYNEITVTLVDFLIPATNHVEDKTVALLYIFDEPRGVGRFEFVDFYSAEDLIIAPNNQLLAVRRTFAPERVEIYELDTGIMLQSFLSAMPEVARGGLLAFDASSSILINDYQRFDIATGEVIFENLQFNQGYDRFFWNDDSETILTATGNRLWEWDFATGEVIRRETLNLGEMVVGVSSDGERYLVAMSNTSNGFGVSRSYEMIEVGMEERTRLDFVELPDVEIEQVIYSPNGRNFMVIYTNNVYNQHYPGNEVMVYNLDEGALWHLAGDDLPFVSARSYGWLDNQTLYVYSEEGTSAPERIYGIDYHVSGIPRCLAEAFPEKIGEWSLVWERLNASLSSASLNRLAVGTCAVLEHGEDAVTSYIFPSPTPTRLPVTATPSTIAGVPICLTNRFSTEARDYAEIWQTLIEGLNEQEIENLELLLCENLTGGNSPRFEPALVTNNVQVMTLDIVTGVRSVGSYIPEREAFVPPNLDLVRQAYSRQFGGNPEGLLSPNLEFYAVRTQTGQIAIYRLVNPYSALADAATGTAEFFIAQSSPEARILSLRPTATQGFTYLGQPRPTFTPTITPTSPPSPEGESYLGQYGQVSEICPYSNLFSLENRPPDFAATGRIISHRLDNVGISGVEGNRLPWVLNPQTGEFTLEDDLPACHANSGCALSYDGQWMYYSNEFGDIILARPDGTNAQVLFTGSNNDLNSDESRTGEIIAATATAEASGLHNDSPLPTSIRWRGLSTLEYSYTVYDFSRSRNDRSITVLLSPATGETQSPYSERQPNYNRLSTNTVSVQPGVLARYAVVRTSFNTGRGDGYRYFIYDRQDDEFIYFARLANFPAGEIELMWHPLGTVLYYRYPDDRQWYAFLPETESFTVVGERIGTGDWSRDLRYRIDNYSLPQEEREERIEAEIPIPNLQVWDSETGAISLYCVPEISNAFSAGIWSPDGRYWLFQNYLAADSDFASPPLRTFALDLETGSVTELSQIAGELILWMEEAYP